MLGVGQEAPRWELTEGQGLADSVSQSCPVPVAATGRVWPLDSEMCLGQGEMC